MSFVGMNNLIFGIKVFDSFGKGGYLNKVLFVILDYFFDNIIIGKIEKV